MKLPLMLTYLMAGPLAPIALLSATLAPAQAHPEHQALQAIQTQVDALGLPLRFEINEGQAHDDVHFLARFSGSTTFFTKSDVVLVLAGNPGPSTQFSQVPGNQTIGLPPSVIRLAFPGSNKNVTIEGKESLAGKSHYLIGTNPDEWKREISAYRKIRYLEIYPGIDLVFYGHGENLEFDFLVSPGAEVSNIHMRFDGTSALELEDDGDLIVHSKSGPIKQAAPRIYQMLRNTRTEVSGSYVKLGANEVGLRIGEYDHEAVLVIDPILSYSTFIGPGTGTAIAVDDLGQSIFAGKTFSPDYPVADALQPACTPPPFPGGPPCEDIFVTKLTADGSSLVFSTFLGGQSADGAEGLAIDSTGAIYITGQTWSNDFPVLNAVQDQCAQSSFTGSCSGDAFVVKLSADGSSLIYSTFLGGTQTDKGFDIAVDLAGQAHVTGDVASTDFPTFNPFQPSCSIAPGPFPACQDIFVTKLTADGSNFVYSSFLGGQFTDRGRGVSVDFTGNTYVAGSGSAGFPTVNAFNAECCGVIVSKIAGDGSTLMYSTFLGGGRANGIAVDMAGHAHVTGQTSDADFPVVSAVQPWCSSSIYGCSQDAFLSKLAVDGASLVYSTYLGGQAIDEGNGIALDSRGRAIIAGTTHSVDFPIVDPIQELCTGTCNDAFVTALEIDGSSIIYSTYLGGSVEERGLAIAGDLHGAAYVTGFSLSEDFPLANPFEASCCGVIAAKIGFPQLLTVTLSPMILWPPSHRMVDIQANVTTPDTCAADNLVLISVTSDEADDQSGSGDGSTTNDIQGAAPGTMDLSFRLRAERSGTGLGRTYSVTYSAVDCAGASYTGAASVFVPHDMMGGVEPMLLSAYETDLGLVLEWDSVWDADSYRVVRGQIENLLEGPEGYLLGELTCIADGMIQTSTIGSEDTDDPGPGHAFFYLAEYNSGQPSSFGSARAQKDRIVVPANLLCP